MKKTLLIMATLAPVLTISACAGGQVLSPLPTDDCKTTDWYQVGYRDGTVSGRSDFEHYADHCKGPFAPKPDEAAYKKGLEAGRGRR